MRPWLIAMLLMTAVLAGCSEEPAAEVHDEHEDHEDHDDHEDHAQDDHDDHSVDNNTAPVANLTADVLNDTAPLLVNITLNGSDADGDNLTWIFHHNGTEAANGTDLPHVLALNLTAGNHTFLLIVSDGQSDATANLTITVAPGATGPCGGEAQPCIIVDDHPWVTVWSDGRCDAKGTLGDDALGWIHDRPGPAIPGVGGNPAGGDWPMGTGFLSGGGTWLYEESNGLDGLQLSQEPDETGGVDPLAVEFDCQGGDVMVI